MPASPLELVWAPTARRDLVDIWFYFAGVGSPEVAERLLRDIDNTVSRLLRHPMAGRPREDIAPSLRSVLVQPYAILYRLSESAIEIVRVLHTRRDFAAAFSDDV